MSAKRILVIGFGAIASELVRALTAPSAEAVVGVLLRAGSRAAERIPAGVARLTTMREVTEFAPQLVVEAAGHGAVRDSVPQCLSLGLPVLISSIGALHDEALLAGLVETARESQGRLLLTSGALGALDYIRAVRGARDLRLSYQSRKPPAAWSAELKKLGHDPSGLSGSLTLFEGSAREAAAMYPQNLNVAAALALAGPGFDQTRVSVVCDPMTTDNIHVVQVESELGAMTVTTTNRPSPDNPKSSWIVSQSLLAAIRQHFSPIVML